MQKPVLKLINFYMIIHKLPTGETFDFCFYFIFLILSSSITFQQIAIKTFK